MTYTAPPNFTTGAIVTESQLDTLSDDITFLANPPKCRVYNSAAVSIADATSTALLFDSEEFDTDTMHSTAVNTSRLTFTRAGTYLVGGDAVFADNATGERGLWIRLNGASALAPVGCAAAPTGGPTASSLSTSVLRAFSASDYVELMVYQNATAPLNVTVGIAPPTFWAIWKSL